MVEHVGREWQRVERESIKLGKRDRVCSIAIVVVLISAHGFLFASVIKKSRYFRSLFLSFSFSHLTRRNAWSPSVWTGYGLARRTEGWTRERQRFDNFSPMTSGDEKLAWNPLFAPSGSDLFPIYRPCRSLRRLRTLSFTRRSSHTTVLTFVKCQTKWRH